jgi:hypothetical protein
MLEGITVHYVRTVDQALDLALEKTPVTKPASLKKPEVDRPAPSSVPPLH